MFEIKGDEILVSTERTSLVFSHSHNGKLTCEYYGRKIRFPEEVSFLKRNYPVLYGGECVLNRKDSFSNNMIKGVCSTMGNGDYFSPAFVVSPFCTLDFVFAGVENEKETDFVFPLPHDPSSSFVILLKDETCSLFLKLHLLSFDKEDVIGAYYELINGSGKSVFVNKAMSFQLCLVNQDDTLVSTYGSWANELNTCETKIVPGRFVLESGLGSSSARHNPSFYIKEGECTSRDGNCYGFNLMYSGNFEDSIEMDAFSNIRIQSGILSTGFMKEIAPEEGFVTPCFVFSFSYLGTNVLSNNMQSFVNHHVIPKEFMDKERPIVYNNWEATGMKFNKGKIVSLMKKAKSLGIETFVLDDGWFSSRDDDSHGLGDWEVNLRKIPGGLASLAKEAEKLSLSFGIWMEPEMVNEDSRVYQNHPDWIIHDSHKAYTGRNQYVLDLSKEEVQQFVLKSVSDVLSSARISYLKWDYNRNFTNMASSSLNYDYIVGLYRVLRTLKERFPDVLFENCASGGNRFDLGMLSFFPQSWMSDDTDSFKRESIQKSAMVNYPLSVMSNHVAAKTSNQLLRKTSLETKFDVACFGILGYELDLDDLSPLEEKTIKEQISFYKKYRKVLQFGQYYLVQERSGSSDLILQAYTEKTSIVGYFRSIDEISFKEERLFAYNLNPESFYEYENRIEHIPLEKFGNLVNYISPIHLKEDGMLFSLVSRFKDMLSEHDHGFASGNTILSMGPCLAQEWTGSGYNENIRLMGDFSSRLYVISKVDR